MTLSQLVRLLLRGSELTAELSAIVIAVSTVLGILLAATRTSVRPVGWVIAIYAWLLRGTPPLVVLYFVFFGAPAVGIVLAPFPSAAAALILVDSAYISEIFRAGLASVPNHQREAAASLGLGAPRTFFRILLPQAFTTMMPAYITQATEVVKTTSLASAIGVTELTGQVDAANSLLLQPFKVFAIAGLLYLLMNSLLIAVESGVQKHAARRLAHFTN